jgi:hypothetical protein
MNAAELRAQVAALRGLLQAIADGAVVPIPVHDTNAETFSYDRYLQQREAFLQAQRDRAVQVRGAAEWALSHPADADVSTRVLRKDIAAPLPYPHEPELEPEAGS